MALFVEVRDCGERVEKYTRQGLLSCLENTKSTWINMTGLCKSGVVSALLPLYAPRLDLTRGVGGYWSHRAGRRYDILAE